MNSTVDVATAEGWFASGQRIQTIFFSPPLPLPPAHMWNRGWGHETGELSTRPTRGWAKSGPSVFSWDDLIDDEGRRKEREKMSTVCFWKRELLHDEFFPRRSQKWGVYYLVGRNFFFEIACEVKASDAAWSGNVWLFWVN